MFSRDYYESKFRSYADLVLLTEMRKMLGGIGDRKAMTLIHSGRIKAFYINQKYLIPKICIIDYLLSLGNSPDNCSHLKKTKRLRKPGTGCLRQLNEHLWEGKFAPINSNGQRITRCVYAKSHDECEKKLLLLIETMKQEMILEKAASVQ